MWPGQGAFPSCLQGTSLKQRIEEIGWPGAHSFLLNCHWHSQFWRWLRLSSSSQDAHFREIANKYSYIQNYLFPNVTTNATQRRFIGPQEIYRPIWLKYAVHFFFFCGASAILIWRHKTPTKHQQAKHNFEFSVVWWQ